MASKLPADPLGALGELGAPTGDIDLFVALVPEVLPVTPADADLARELLASTAGISARDVVHGAVMINNGVDHVATFDRGFDRLGRVSRFEL